MRQLKPDPSRHPSGPRSGTILRDRLLDAAAAAFRPGRLATAHHVEGGRPGGISRQTIYNEFGTKQQLAEQLVMRELDIFLDVVRESSSTEASSSRRPGGRSSAGP